MRSRAYRAHMPAHDRLLDPFARLMRLVQGSGVHLESDPLDRGMLEACDYEWQLSTIETNTRLDLTLQRIHATPEQAFAAAADCYDAVLACGFYAFGRSEIQAARVAARSETEDEWLGWRGRLDVGLRLCGDPRGMRRPSEPD